MSDQRYYIPRYIDEPYRIVIFTMDELVLVLLTMMFAFAVGHELIGIVAASTICVLYRKFKAKESSSFLRRYIYWKFKTGPRNYIPSSKQKKYKG